MTLRVKDWSENFENNRTRELKNLSFVCIPNKLDGDGYTELIDHPAGVSHYGAWVAMVHVASRCDIRGTLSRGENKPHNSSSLSRITRIPKGVFDEAIPRLLEIGWLEDINTDTQTTCEMPHHSAGKSHHSAQEQNRTERSSVPSLPSPPSPLPGELVLPSAWDTPEARKTLGIWFDYIMPKKPSILDRSQAANAALGFFKTHEELERSISVAIANGYLTLRNYTADKTREPRKPKDKAAFDDGLPILGKRKEPA